MSEEYEETSFEANKFGFVEVTGKDADKMEIYVRGEFFDDEENLLTKIAAAKIDFYEFEGKFRKLIGNEAPPFCQDMLDYARQKMNEYQDIVLHMEYAQFKLKAQSTSLSGMVVLRAIGIFVAPLGYFLGLSYLF